MSNWHSIHDFMHGWGYMDGPRTIFLQDVSRFLKINSLLQLEECDNIFEQLKPFLAKEAEAIKKRLEENPIKFDKFVFPKVKRQMPDLKELMKI